MDAEETGSRKARAAPWPSIVRMCVGRAIICSRGRGPDQEALLSNVEVDVPLLLVGQEGAKVAAYSPSVSRGGIL